MQEILGNASCLDKRIIINENIYKSRNLWIFLNFFIHASMIFKGTPFRSFLVLHETFKCWQKLNLSIWHKLSCVNFLLSFILNEYFREMSFIIVSTFIHYRIKTYYILNVDRGTENSNIHFSKLPCGIN